MFFLCGGGALFYFVNSQIKPEEIKLAIKEKIEKSIPGAEVTLGDLSVNYGPSIFLRVKGMDVLLKKELSVSRDFFKVSEIEVRLPIWSLITGGGNLDVNLVNPEVFLRETKEKKGNWSRAFDGAPKEEKISHKQAKAVEKQANVILPSFIVNSTIGVRLNNLQVYYDIKGKEGVWSVSKLVLKNLGLTSNAAFEIQSKFKRVKNDEDFFSLDTVMVGSIEFEKYLKTGHLNIDSSFKVKNLKYSYIRDALPTTRGDFSISLNKTGLLKGKFNAFYKSSEFKTNFLVDENGNAVMDNVHANLSLGDFNDIWKANGYQANLANAKATLNGELNYKENSIIPKMNFSLSGLTYPYQGNDLILSLEGLWNEDLVISNGLVQAFGGEAKFKSEATFKINSSEPLEKRLSHYSADVDFNKIKITKSLVDSLTKSDVPPNKEGEKIIAKAPHFFLLPKGILNVTLNSASLENETIEGGITLKTDQDKISFKNGVILSKEGKIKIEGKGKIFDNHIELNHNLNFKSWNLALTNSLLDKNKFYLKTVVDGDISGSYHYPGEATYKVSLVSGKGSFFNFDLGQVLGPFYDSLDNTVWAKTRIFTKKKVSNEFEGLKVKATFGVSEHHFKELKIKTFDHLFDVSGFIDPVNKKRKRMIVLVKGGKELDSFLKKKTKLNAFPIGLYSYGYKLELDELYHLKKFSEKFRFKKDRAMAKEEILKVRAKIKGKENEKS